METLSPLTTNQTLQESLAQALVNRISNTLNQNIVASLLPDASTPFRRPSGGKIVFTSEKEEANRRLEGDTTRNGNNTTKQAGAFEPWAVS